MFTHYSRTKISVHFFMISMLFRFGASQAQETSQPQTSTFRWYESGQQVTALVDWCRLQTSTADCNTNIPPNLNDGTIDSQQPRISSDTQVSIHVTSFNFLHYNLDYQFDEEQIEAYAYLSGLWDQLLGFDISTLPLGTVLKRLPGTDSELTGIDEITSWWVLVRTMSVELTDNVMAFQAVHLTSQELETLEDLRDYWRDQITQLSSNRDTAFATAETVEHFQQFDIVDRDHAQLISSINTFVELAQRSLVGDSQNVGRKSAGTFVTVTIQPTALPTAPQSSTRLESESFDYLVESNYPLLYHIGLTRSQLSDAKFDTVKALDGRELFAQVREEDGTDAFSAYLSYPLDRDTDENSNWYATLGTDFSDIGERLYVGVSRQFNSRWLLTAGGAYGLVTVGKGEMSDMSNDEPTSRTLFELIEENREWEAFVSISVRVY